MIRTARVVDSGEVRARDAAAGSRCDDCILVMNDDIPSAKAASSRRFWGVKERAYKVSDPMGLTPKPGDTVEIFLPPGQTVFSAALTFLLPLALFPVGFFLAGRLFPGTAEATSGMAADSEGLSFLVGFGFLLAGIPLGALIRHITGKSNAVPQITRVLTSAEALQCSKKNGIDCGSCTLCG